MVAADAVAAKPLRAVAAALAKAPRVAVALLKKVPRPAAVAPNNLRPKPRAAAAATAVAAAETESAHKRLDQDPGFRGLFIAHER